MDQLDQLDLKNSNRAMWRGVTPLMSGLHGYTVPTCSNTLGNICQARPHHQSVDLGQCAVPWQVSSQNSG